MAQRIEHCCLRLELLQRTPCFLILPSLCFLYLQVAYGEPCELSHWFGPITRSLAQPLNRWLVHHVLL